MPADPEPLELFRNGYLGRLPAFAASRDPRTLLAAVADSLNACERSGIIMDADTGALSCRSGYVLPVGDDRLGSRWVVRMKAAAESSDEDRGEVMPNDDSQFS